MTSINLSKELQLVIQCAQEKKAQNITVLDLRNLTSFTDYFVICSGESEPQIKSIYQNIHEKLSAQGYHLHHVEGRVETGWLLMDYDDFIVHIFLPDKRNYYDLERLWTGASRVEVEDTVVPVPPRVSAVR